PPDLKHGDKIVIDKKVIGQGLRGTPPRWPVLQAEVADRNRRVRRLLLCEWPTLEGTSRHHRVRNIGELLASSGVSGMVAVEHELHEGLHEPEGPLVVARRVPRPCEQCAGLLRDDAGA